MKSELIFEILETEFRPKSFGKFMNEIAALDKNKGKIC